MAPVPTIPLELDRLIIRAMRKDPDRRFQSMVDLRVALLEIKEELDSGRFVSAKQVRREARPVGKRWLWAAVAFVMIGLGVAAWLYFSPAEPIGPPPRTVPLTTYPGNEYSLAMSPDGKQVVFIWRKGEEQTVHFYVKLIGGGDPLALTSGLV
jgi:hypothetical protein